MRRSVARCSTPHDRRALEPSCNLLGHLGLDKIVQHFPRPGVCLATSYHLPIHHAIPDIHIQTLATRRTRADIGCSALLFSSGWHRNRVRRPVNQEHTVSQPQFGQSYKNRTKTFETGRFLCCLIFCCTEGCKNPSFSVWLSEIRDDRCVTKRGKGELSGESLDLVNSRSWLFPHQLHHFSLQGIRSFLG